MRGDFSRWQFQERDNFNGILPQQGKLLIDADGLAQTRIANHWRQKAARDWVGPVAGAPADEPAAFQITAATVNADGSVALTVGSGHIWADGMLVELDGDAAATVQRTATWLEPPVAPSQGSAATAAGAQGVVVLELWQEGISGYQLPNTLIEPALGGPDTAERLHTAMAFRLARLTAGQTCKSLTFSDSGRGKLTASLLPATTITGDCPLPVGGGYSGFEHALYRIEIADVPSGSASMFKWSRENGGLAGRGTFNPAGPNTITITANLVAVTTANQATFYVEIEAWDAAHGNWQVVCGGSATLNNGTLTFTGAAAFGTYPAAQANVFFRLWEGISPVSAFPIQASPIQLENGIFLQFDPDGPAVYRPRDYWVFPVRAGGIANPQILIDKKPPEGIVYRRVPLAEIAWDASLKATIQDCRATITPLTAPGADCCTVQVGDGLTTFARFTSIQEAINSLPPSGGEVCVLAGRYFESITINQANISIHGCGHRTRIASPSFGPNAGANTGAVITVNNSQDVELQSFVVEAADGDIGIELTGSIQAWLPTSGLAANVTAGVKMRDLIVVSSDSRAVSIEQSIDVSLKDSLIAMRDVSSASAAVYVSGQNIHVMGNWVGPISSADLPAIVVADLTASGAAGVTAPAGSTMANPPCGIQIAGISSDIFVRYNAIEGGSGNGISLGEVVLVDSTGIRVNGYVGYNPGGGKPNPCAAGNFYYARTATYGGATVNVVVSGTLSNVRIENNLIRNMGLCGIGPIGFFDLSNTQEVVTVTGLWIAANEIIGCLNRALTAYTNSDVTSIGYGGICLPDVTGAYIQDNLILNTGASLADPVCGIFVLHGALVEISRNQVQDTRDWSTADANSFSGYRAGIALVMVTPLDAPEAAGTSLTLNTGAYLYKRPILYEYDAPALCIQENLVDIPIGLALSVAGLGGFSIRGNQFSTGGIQGNLLTLGRSIVIFNFGTMLELPTPVSTAAEILALIQELNTGASLTQAVQAVLGTTATILGAIAPGPVNFSHNRCSLNQDYQASVATSSVAIYTFDDLGFHDNQCWVSTTGRQVNCDAMLIGATVRVTGCRFQEIPETVYFSAVTLGLMNTTTLNQGTHAFGAVSPLNLSVTGNNLSW